MSTNAMQRGGLVGNVIPMLLLTCLGEMRSQEVRSIIHTVLICFSDGLFFSCWAPERNIHTVLHQSTQSNLSQITIRNDPPPAIIVAFTIPHIHTFRFDAIHDN